jgi:hypothetical protein
MTTPFSYTLCYAIARSLPTIFSTTSSKTSNNQHFELIRPRSLSTEDADLSSPQDKLERSDIVQLDGPVADVDVVPVPRNVLQVKSNNESFPQDQRMPRLR